MLNDRLQVFFILIQGHMLIVGWHAGIIGTEEDSLSDISPMVFGVHSRFLMSLRIRRSYHEPHISGLRRREELIKDFDSLCGCISTVACEQISV